MKIIESNILKLDIDMYMRMSDYYIIHNDLRLEWKFKKAEQFLGRELQLRTNKIKRDHC